MSHLHSRRTPLTAVVLAIMMSPHMIAAETDLTSLVRRLQPSIVTVIGYDAEGEVTQLGTGFFIDRRGHLITNRHVLQGAARAEIRGSSGRTYPIERVIADDEKADLIKVVVGIPFIRVRPLRIAKSPPEPGQRIVVIGSPFGLEKTVSDGIVSTLRDSGPLGPMVQITAPISKGSSGSPVLDMNGRVLGVATVQLSDGQNLNFAVPGSRILSLEQFDGRDFPKWATETHLALGLRAAVEGEWKTSLAFYSTATDLDATSINALHGVGRAFEAMGRYGEASVAYERSVRLEPNVGNQFLLAQSRLKQNDWTTAVAGFKEVLRLEPGHAEAHHQLGIAYVRLGDRTAAHGEYERLKAIDPARADRLLEEIESAKTDG